MSNTIAKADTKEDPNLTCRRLQEVFQRATLLSAQLRFDYAHELFSHCVMHNSGNLVFAEAMLANLRAKFGNKKKRASILKFGGGRNLKKAVSRADWPEALKLGVEELRNNPWSVPALRALAEASAAGHHNEVELVYLKQALDAAPKDADVNRHCARSLGRMGQFDQAVACWHRVEDIEGRSDEVSREISHLAAEKVKYPNGRPPVAQHAQEVHISDEARSDKPHVVTAVQANPRQALERAIAGDPYDVSNYLELADLLCESQQFQRAEGWLEQGIAVAGRHMALVSRLQRVHEQRIEYEQERARLTKGREDRWEERRVPWMEIALLAAGVALVVQLFPSVGSSIWYGMDFRNWSATAWMVANVAMVLLLCVLRFGQEVLAARKK